MRKDKRRPVGRTVPLAAALMGATVLSALPLAAVADTVVAPSHSIADAVAQVAPAIVPVEVTPGPDRVVSEVGSDNAAGTPARRFGLPDPGRMIRSGLQMRERATGFIVSGDGRIVTSVGAIADASQIRVRLADGQVLAARGLGAEAFTDIAVIKIEATGLPTLACAAPDALQAGTPVLAVGAGYGWDRMVSSGVVLMIGADDAVAPLYDFVQPDAAIGRRNAGDPLLNADADVVAVSARGFTRRDSPMACRLRSRPTSPRRLWPNAPGTARWIAALPVLPAGQPLSVTVTRGNRAGQQA